MAASEAQTTAAVMGCPVIAGAVYTQSQEQIADPFPLGRELRETAPVFFAPELGWYIVTRYEDVRRVLEDVETFSNSPFAAVPDPPAKYADRLPSGYPMRIQLQSSDPPRHTRLRKLFNRGFTPKAATARRADFRRITHRLLDEMLTEPAGRANLISAYADKLPMFTMTTVLDVPIEDWERFAAWIEASSELKIGYPDDKRLDELTETLIEFDTFVRDLIRERRGKPGEDIISRLIQAKEQNDALSDDEIVGLVSSMLIAGQNNVSTTTGHMFWLLLSHREQWDAVREDRSLVPAAVEETLRHTLTGPGPVRLAMRDTEIAGVKIPAGSMVQPHSQWADHDPAVFERPDEFDIRRPDLMKSLAWGHRNHFCPGAPLARAQMEETLETFLDRVPELRLAGDGERRYEQSRLHNTLRNLTVAWR